MGKLVLHTEDIEVIELTLDLVLEVLAEAAIALEDREDSIMWMEGWNGC